ncbi:pyrroloquinoline quinone precursor peptide PqqA [Streptomyces gobiensis]|nr:pyrroloquinoline quinone precursor peptide PqqA [Streptomyces gobiensis]UGY94897.1 pyrroloquinoline quinone precursor peptide PqqA [Streptomyces gobiensis]
MTDSVQQAVEQAAQQPVAGTEESATWQTPDYTVVETGLEVTAYLLSDR